MVRPRSMPTPPLQPRRGVGFEQILERLEAHRRPYRRAFLQRVYDFSREMHKDQTRKSGEPYLTHPVYVAYILADLKLDETCVAVGLLHDVLEDTLTTRSVLEKEFGPDVTELVDGVTKIGKKEYVRRDQAQAETFRKMILASARDLRVILVKLADRMHNMMTLEHMSAEARHRIASETLEIYAPIAMRLGMSKLQGDLEDLAFYHRYPHQFAELETKIREKTRLAKDSLEKIESQLRESLKRAGIEAEISYRVKRFYSIFRKLQRQGIDISQLYDFLAYRVITKDLRDTYAAFGIVHQTWRPIPGRFKDYIAMPKPNRYQSLHTTVVGENGQPFEIQIRTREMDLIAEEGIAAHWQYKEKGSAAAAQNDANISWLRQLLEWQTEVQDPREFLTALKIDLYPDEVYAFTPQGDVLALPRGATPLDFAYRIHTDIGHHCVGARVNGKLVPLRTDLQNGDLVEILTSPQRRPSRDWLGMVATSRAKSKIRHWLNTQQAIEAQTIGRRILERELKKLRLNAKKVFEGPRAMEYLQREGLSKIEDLCQRIAFGKIQWKAAIDAMVEPAQLAAAQEPPGALRRVVEKLMPSSSASGPLTIMGHGDLMSTLALCCRPVPGEDVVGYVTRGRGITVHAADCPNLKKLAFDADRMVDVAWGRQSGSATYPVELMIGTEDQQGMLARLTDVIAREQSNIRMFEAEATETGHGRIQVMVEVQDSKHLERLCRAVRGVPGVLKVDRVIGGGRREEKGREDGRREELTTRRSRS